MSKKRLILVSGWRGIPHSYAVTTQFWCREMLRRPDLELYFEDKPFWNERWQTTAGIFDTADEKAVMAIPPMPPLVRPDAELRTGFPTDIVTPPLADKVVAFSTSEYGMLPAGSITDRIPLEEAHKLHNGTIEIVTSSVWSRNGYLNSGADPTRVHLVPLGVDTSIFHPATPEERATARLKFQIGQDDLVFLNIGAMTENKGIRLLLRAFCAVLEKHPNARLVLKGLESLYSSYQMFKNTMMATVAGPDLARMFSRLTYIGGSLGIAEVAQLHHAADCYVAPYAAEGFNLPALEAVASGLPLICTSGGPTDDYTTPDFALRIRSELMKGEVSGGDKQWYPAIWLAPEEEHLQELMFRVIDDAAFRQRAWVAGPSYVAEKFTWKHSTDKLLRVLFPPS
jgi:glycosyltransferase involved in cell wall biosynthesis